MFHTGLGHVVLLALIQLGGIGTMAASVSLVVPAGRHLRRKQTAALRETMDLTPLGQVRGQLRTLMGVTAAAEIAGAFALRLRGPLPLREDHDRPKGHDEARAGSSAARGGVLLLIGPGAKLAEFTR